MALLMTSLLFLAMIVILDELCQQNSFLNSYLNIKTEPCSINVEDNNCSYAIVKRSNMGGIPDDDTCNLELNTIARQGSVNSIVGRYEDIACEYDEKIAKKGEHNLRICPSTNKKDSNRVRNVCNTINNYYEVMEK